MGFINSFDLAFVTWWPLIFYPLTAAPNYRNVYIASITTGALILPLILGTAYLEKREIKKGTLGRKFESEERAEEGSRETEGESDGEIVTVHLSKDAS